MARLPRTRGTLLPSDWIAEERTDSSVSPMESEAGMKAAVAVVHGFGGAEAPLAAVAEMVHGESGVVSAGRTDYSDAVASGTSSEAKVRLQGTPGF